MTPHELLAAARDLMQRPDASVAGIWPRAAALLARQALEAAMAELWAAQRQTTGLSASTMRSQVLCLTAYLDRGTASRAAYLLAALSQRLPLPPLRTGPHRRRTHQLARPGRPPRNPAPSSQHGARSTQPLKIFMPNGPRCQPPPRLPAFPCDSGPGPASLD